MEYVRVSHVCLMIESFFTQRRRALYEDSCLFVVPESHKSPRTNEQRSQSSTPDPPVDPLTMPNAIRVTLQRTCVQVQAFMCCFLT